MMTIQEIAEQLVALNRAGRNVEAVDTLMSEDVVSVEARGDDTMPAVMTGRDVIRGKNEWWVSNHKIHQTVIKGPYPNGERFAVTYDFVVTPVSGPMAGKKMRMQEVALYTVTDGKISREEFFYDMSGDGEAEPKAAATPRPRARKAAPRPNRIKAKARTNAKTTRRAPTRKAPSKKKAGRR